MNRKKLLTIQVLKDRVNEMQKNIHKLEVKKESNLPQRNLSRSNSRSQSPSPFHYTSSNKRFKSPTFWTGNTILGEENPYYLHSSSSPSPKAKRQVQRRSKSPVIQKITKEVDLQFYQSVPSQITQSIENINPERFQKPVYFGKRYEYKVMDYLRSAPKIEKKKTFQVESKDPILSPEMNRISYRKIVGKPHPSPTNMYTENSNSNKDLYFNSTQPISLSPIAVNNRNNSPNLKLLLSSSEEDLKKFNSVQRSHKKHYGRHYQENLSSKWRQNW